MKLALRERTAGNTRVSGDYQEHSTKLWDILSDHSKKAVQVARKKAVKADG